MAMDIIFKMTDPVRLRTPNEFDRLTGTQCHNNSTPLTPYHVPEGATTPVVLNMFSRGKEWSPSWCTDRDVLRATYEYVRLLQVKAKHSLATERSFESYRRLEIGTFPLSEIARGHARSTFDDDELKQLVTRFELSDRSGRLDFHYVLFHDFRLFEAPIGCFKKYDNEPVIDLEKIKASRATVAHRWRMVREAVATRPIVFLLQSLAAQRRARPDGAVARISMHVDLGNADEEARARRELRAELFEAQVRRIMCKRKFGELLQHVDAREAELLE